MEGQSVRWIVPFSAGGGLDVYARLLKPFYEEALGSQITVENRPGAGGRLGARVIRDSRPDGRTLGIVNGYALLVMGLAEGVTGLHPVDDFTVLGRVARGDPVMVTAPGSPFASIEDVVAHSGEMPIVFGLNGVSGTAFVATSVTADLLDVDATYLVGYPGTRESSLGLIRGEFDLGAFTFESIRDRVEAGDLIPILRIASADAELHPSLNDVPALAGSDGLASRVARERGEGEGLSLARADALARMFEVGRLVVAPPGLPDDMANCLSDRLAQVVRDPALRAAAQRARRALAFAEPATVAAELESTEDERGALAAILARHAALARGGPATR